MEQYVVLDVSLNEISICVIDGKGAVPFEGESMQTRGGRVPEPPIR
jgi:hypothetical protein